MKRMLRTTFVPLLIALQIAILCVGAASALPLANLKVKILAINDFHGQLSPKTVSGRPAGGAAVLASYLKDAQKLMVPDSTIIVSDGDFVGASPANSALLQDEPSIMFLNTLANSSCLPDKMNPRCNIVATVGNHEFDEGTVELFRMMHGGNYVKGPYLENPYSGAHFPYVAANVIDNATGKTLLPPYVIKTVRNTPIAFIGAILKDTPNIVAPAGVAGLSFIDEATAINSYIPELKAKGVKAIIAVIHQGAADVDAIVAKLDGEIDVVISGHSHISTNKLVNNAAGKPVLVTQAYSAGTAFANIDIEIDPVGKDIVKKSAVITTTYGDVAPGNAPDAKVAAIVAQADTIVAPLVNVEVGQTSAAITRNQNPAGESALGDLIADAQRAYEGTEFAFMNPGGIRADLDQGPVTWGELFTIQPFGNQMVRMTLTGQQIYDLLAQQWSTPAAPKMLQISGLTYSWTNNGPGVAGTVTEVRKNSVPIDKSATYTVTTNNFLSGGGDGFTVFKSGLNPVIDAADIDVLVSYIRSEPVPFDVLIDNRIIRKETVPTQFVYTSDSHYGINRGDIGGGLTTAVQVNGALVATINALQSTTTPVAIPCDGGVNACSTTVGALDFIAHTGDIANRSEGAVGKQTATVSWGQFKTDYLTALTVKDRNNSTAPIYLVPGNHDVSNAIGYYKAPLNVGTGLDATAYVTIYNLMLKPSTLLTNDGFIGSAPSLSTAETSYANNKVFYSKDLGGVHFVFINMWPDSKARAWMDSDLRKVSPTTPVVLFTHDQPDIETKHLMNPNGTHDINANDKFENLVKGEKDEYASVTTTGGASTVEQAALASWLQNHKNIVAYFHGNSNWNQFYTFTGPNNNISLNTFRVDSPMKGEASKTDLTNLGSTVDPSRLSYQVISIDKDAATMTVREYRWNAKIWGDSITVSLAPRSN